MLDPSKPAQARAEQRLRSEQIAWLTKALGSEPGPFARTYSAAIRVRPTRVRVW